MEEAKERVRCPFCGKVAVFPNRQGDRWEAIVEDGEEYPKHLRFEDKILCPRQFGSSPVRRRRAKRKEDCAWWDGERNACLIDGLSCVLDDGRTANCGDFKWRGGR
jgi:hypothetical protein